MNLRMKNNLFCLVLLTGLTVGAYGASCDNCWATYNAAASKTCTEANAFITCMEDAVNPGCPTSALNIAAFIGQIASCTLTSLCTCQKDHLLRWSEGTTTQCESEKRKIGCIGGVTDAACDASTKGHTIATSTDTDITNIAGCAAGLTDTCQCEKTYATTDISATAGRCTAKKTFVNCLKDKTATPCKSGETVISLATAVGTTIGTDCTSFTTSACSCELDYAKADVSSQANRCTAQLNLVSCLKGKTGAGCTGGTTHALATTAFDTDIPAIVTSGTACATTDTCTCEATYAKTDISTDHCSAMKTYVNCLKDKTAAACKSGETVITLATAIETPIGTACTSFATSACSCELGYAKSDISSNANKCTALLNLVSCLKGKTGAGCTGGTTHALATTAVDTDIPAIAGLGTACGTTGACACEATYAKTDISSDHCSAMKTYVNCLKDKTTPACKSGETVITLATAIETPIGTACTSFSTSACSCELGYAKSDISSNANKCTALLKLVSCLKGKTGAGCTAGTARTLAGTAVDTDIAAIVAGGTTCDLTDTCTCEANYAKADISSDPNHCIALGTFVQCLKTKTATGCEGTAVTGLGTTAETNYGTLTSTCAIASKTCGCEVAYVKMPYSSSTEQCTAEMTLISCLKGKAATDKSCDDTSTPIDLATAAGNKLGSCSPTDTCTSCELVYAKAAIDTNTKKCDALAAFLVCLRSKTDAGCVSTDTVSILAGQAETDFKAAPNPGCTVTDTCQCEIDYIKATRTQNADKCTASKTLVTCLKDKTDVSCDGTTKPSDLATIAENAVTGIANCLTDTCQCEVEYVKADHTVPGNICGAKTDFLDCMSQSFDAGCDGTKRHTMATALDFTGCSARTGVCSCQEEYTKKDNTDPTAHCAAIKAHLDCLDTEVTTAACKSTTTVQALATLMETQRGSTAGCAALTSTCQCQVNYLKHTRANAGEVCTAHKEMLDCLMTAKDDACDGSTPRNTIVTARKTPPTSCTFSTTCTTCMIPFGEDPYAVPVNYCGSLQTLMQCLDGQAIFTDRGCDDTKTISQLVNSFSSDVSSCTGVSATCTCQIDYMKSPGTTPADKCTALTTKMHCLDKTAETACDSTVRRDQIASAVDTAIVDTGTIPLSATCRTDVTATCDCQTTYAKTNPTGDCAALYAKIECIAGEKSFACLSSVKPVAVATETVGDITALGATCTSTETDTCSCQKTLAETDILLGNQQHCAALVAALLCLKGKSAAGCDTATVDSLDVQWKKDIDTIGTTDCPQSDTCACEVAYAKSTLTTLQDKCTAWLAELACLRTTTAVGCDGSSTKAEIDTAIKTNMNAATTAGGATNDKCTTNPVCLCEIEYAVATKTTPADQCTALKNFIGCLAGETVSGCDGTTKPWTLAADAKTALDNIGTTTCPLSTTCSCEIDLATTTIDDDTKKCNALKTNMDCIIKSSTTSCRGTDRHTYAGAVKTAMDGTTGCPATYASAGICKDCVIPFATTASTCTTLDNYYHCLYMTSDTTGCGGSKNIKTLADDQATHDTSLTCVSPRRDVCACQVAFLKTTAALCDALKVLMNCLWAGTVNACDNTVKRDAIATAADGKIDTACRGTLSDVCNCQVTYAKADTGAGHCAALIAQFACLEGKTGTGCESSRTLKQVAEGGNTKFGTDSCSTTDTCLCQKAYLIADVSGANKCPETEKKIACLYATTTASCDAAVPRTTIMANTDNTCSKTQTCACQRAYGIDTGGDECAAQKGVVTCLRTTTDTGCTGEAAFTKTRSQLGDDLETFLQSATCSAGLTDTCQCEVDYAKAIVDPASSKCTALKTLILCLADKTALGCDAATKPSDLATAAHNDIKLDSTCVVTTTCECEITYAKTDVSSNKCDAQRTKMECLYNSETLGCDGTSTRNTLVDAFKADLVSGACAATTSDVCKTCMINYAAVDPAGAKCSALKTFLGCLDTKTASLTSCDGSQTIIQLATAADQAITNDASCNAMDTCSCTIDYLKTARADDTAECNALKTKMDCLVKATATACDGSDRHTYAGTVETAMDGVTGCPATYPVGSICKDCEIPMATTSPTCTVLETYYHCLYTTTGTTSCDGSKNIKTLVDDQASQDTSLSCVSPRRDVCACQVAFMKSTAALCDALKVLMNCLWAGTANACDNTVKRDAIAITADGKIDTTCRGTLSDVCKCQIAYAKADTGAGHCAALIAQFACLEGKTGTGCESSRTLKQVAEGGNTKFGTDSCTTTDTCSCQKAYLIADVSGANKCPETEKKIACLYATTTASCDAAVPRTTIMANTDDTCSKTQTCACQRAYGIDTGGDECAAQKGVVTCLRTTTDTGCTGEAAFTKTRSQLGDDLETFLQSATCSAGLTDTCQCEVDYAKATVDPAASKCTALKTLILCLADKTALGCDAATKPSDLAIAAHNDIKLDSTCVVTTTCECEITYAKTDVSSNKCDAQRTKMECLYNSETLGCDGTSTRNTLVDAFKADLVSGACAATTSDVCKTCMINYAAVDPAGAKCSALKTFLGCLDTKTASLTSCDGSQSIIQLATAADQAITNDASCNAMDTCSCTIDYLKTARADDTAECNALKTKMDCLVKATATACDGSDRHTYAGTVETAMDGVTSCPATYPVGSICKDCEIPMATASPTCTVLETYYHCLYTTTGTTSCDGSKNIKTLVDDQASQDTSLSCVSPRRDVCACQVAFMKSTAALCDALKVLMNCLWAGTANACDNTVKRDAIATAADAKIDTTCRGTLSDVCKCQIAYAKADTGAGHCTALIAQFACLEGKTGTGCESSRTLKQVAEGGNTKFGTDSCTTTDTCLCQKAYLVADVSGANKCPETEKKIACLYATTSASCDATIPRTTIMANTDDTCSKTLTCACQRAYGIDTGGVECAAQKGVVTCLRTTTDTGCTGEAAFTKTRSQLGGDLETFLQSATCSAGLTDTCQCEIDYAKATVNPAASKCTALGELILCLSGKTALGCDGSTKASALASTAHSEMQTDSCTITDTCLCQITNAKIDVTVAQKCPGLFDQMDCVFRSAAKGCDGTTKRKKVAEDLVAALSAASCTTASDVCSSCIYTYAQVDVEVPATRCSGLGAFLYCLDGKTTTSCKSTSQDSVATLATYARTEITKAGSTCSALTDTCECQYTFLTTANSATTCSEHAKRMECIVAATGAACDPTVTRSTYATNIAEPNLKAVTSCESTLTNTCTLCQFAYAKETSATQTNRCDALKNYFHCLDSKTAVSCFGSKSVTTLATEANARAVSDSCSLGTTCQCQANFLKADKSDTAKTCTANKDKLSCLATSFDDACDGSSPRNSVAVSTFAALPSATCGALNTICTCEKNYAVEPFTDETVHCTNLKTAADCLEGLSGAGCGTTATASTFATAVLAKINSITSCTLSDTCACQIGFIASDVSTPALKCTALEKEAGCVYEASDVSCDATVSRTATLTSVGAAITADSCTVPGTCTCQIAYGTSSAADCTKKFTLIGCLQTTADDGCRGHTTVQTRTALATMVENAAACTKTDACTCQINYAKADVTGANKCLEQKKLAVCLGATETDGCNGGKSHTLAATAVGVINGIAGCAPAAQTTCKCELDYAVADRTTSDGKCSAARNLLHCLTFTTDAGCARTRAAVATVAQTAIADLEAASAGSCPLTSSCTCQQTFVTATSFSNDAEKCLEYKKLAVCLGNNNDVACDNSTSKNDLVTSVEAKAKSIASCATGLSSSTCQCEIDYAKTDTSDNAKKCTAYNKMLTCMFSSTGDSCVGTAKSTFVTTIDTNVKSASISCTAQTAECTCAVAYAKVDFATATNAAKCSAAQDLLGCMTGKTGTGCDGMQSSSALLSTAENTISLAVAAGTTCAVTESCKCEVLFGKADTTNDAAYCSAGLNYFACLSVATDAGCSGTTNDALKQAALAKVVTIKGCALPDTCQCQQTFTTSVAANSSQECRYALNALSCLSATTSQSCDKTQTQSQVASYFHSKVANLSSTSCYQTETCKCQIAYATTDTTTSSTKCTAGRTYNTCLNKIQNDQDVGCDDVTQKQYLMQGHVSLVLQACRGCSISHPSVAVILILAVLTLLWKH